MTTLDPSHFPWLARTSDPATGAAVHTSVTPFPGHKVRRASSSSSLSSSEEDEGEADEQDWFRKRISQHKARIRHEREQARASNKIPTIPVPDVRFEQSYLMSIQPFIHSEPVARHTDLQATPSKTNNKDKRRRVEESLALVEDPASRTGSGLDDVFAKDHQISVEWNKIVYITIRDQVLSPLVQGALWAVGGILLSSATSYWRAARPSTSSLSSSKPGNSIFEKLWAPFKQFKKA